MIQIVYYYNTCSEFKWKQHEFNNSCRRRMAKLSVLPLHATTNIEKHKYKLRMMTQMALLCPPGENRVARQNRNPLLQTTPKGSKEVTTRLLLLILICNIENKILSIRVYSISTNLTMVGIASRL
jgi:hypothetical protein